MPSSWLGTTRSYCTEQRAQNPRRSALGQAGTGTAGKRCDSPCLKLLYRSSLALQPDMAFASGFRAKGKKQCESDAPFKGRSVRNGADAKSLRVGCHPRAPKGDMSSPWGDRRAQPLHPAAHSHRRDCASEMIARRIDALRYKAIKLSADLINKRVN